MDHSPIEELAAAQRRLSLLIRDPDGVAEGLVAAGDADGRALAALLRDDRRVGAVERVSIYAHAYFARLRECLEADFGALARALGPDVFGDLVRTYVMMSPPSRPSLRHAGAQLADHLNVEPFASIFARTCPYARDLARLEWALCESFSAADAAVLERSALAAVPAEAWPELELRAQPSLRVLECDWPVHLARARFDQEPEDATWPSPPALPARATYLRVLRVGEQVRVRELTRVERVALSSLRSGVRFETLCAELVALVGEAEAAVAAAGFVAAWVAEGLLAA